MLPSEDVIHLRGNEVLLHCQGMSDEDIRDIAWPNDRWTDLDVAGQVSAGLTVCLLLSGDVFDKMVCKCERKVHACVVSASLSPVSNTNKRVVLLLDSNTSQRVSASANIPHNARRMLTLWRQVLMLRQMFPGDEWPAARDTIVTIPYAGTVRPSHLLDHLV